MSAPQLLTHMSQKDLEVFATYYYSDEAQQIQGWEFDVITGDPEDPGAFYPPNYRRQALYLNSLKIDALAWFFETPTIVECKPNATAGAIGQVLTYKLWYRLNFSLDCSMMIVCSRMSRQLRTACQLNDIAVRIVPPSGQALIDQMTREIRPKIVDRSKQLLYSALKSA